MKKLVLLALATTLTNLANASPLFSLCVSDDQKVAVTLSAQSGDTNLVDLLIKSNASNRPTEISFPCQENANEEMAKYTLLDTEFEVLIVNRSTGKGKLSKGQFGSPNPFVEVSCQ